MIVLANDILGFDIVLDVDRQAIVAANGELIWGQGLPSAVQDIRLRIYTYLGGLFYDRRFGSTILDYIHDESTPARSATERVIKDVDLDD